MPNHQQPLVGRSEELAQLDSALDRARSGLPAIVLLCGEAGLGKSRLAEEAATIAGRQGMFVCWGHAWELGGTPAFWPWVQVLRRLRDHVADRLEMPNLARLLPELGEAPSGGQSADERFALFDAVLRFLLAASEHRPTVVVLEDLHAADLASLELLAFVARHLHEARLALIATYRPTEARVPPTRAELFSRVRRSGQELLLRPLAQPEVGELVASSTAVPLGDDAIARIHEHAEGNPLFVTEMLRGLSVQNPADWRPSVPGSAQLIVRERLAVLSPEQGAMLEVAACIGREFDAVLLARVCERPLDATLSALASVAGVGLIREQSAPRHAFAHGLFAQVLHDGIEPARRSTLHVRIADELERLHAGDPAGPIAEIAHHLLSAGASAGARAAAVARSAADSAMRTLAFEEAALLLERAVRAQRLAAPGDTRERAELLLALGQARSLSGDSRGSREACQEAAGLARTLESPELFARAALGYGAVFTIGVTDPVLVQLLEEALRALAQTESSLRARLLGRLAAALQPAPDPRAPIALARQAIEIAERVDDRSRLEILHVASAGLAKLAPPYERLKVDRDACVLAERFAEPALALRAHARLVFDHLEIGDMHAALGHIGAYQNLAARLRQPGARWPAAMLQAMIALYQGRFADHRQYLAEARTWVEQADDEMASFCLELHRVGVLRTLGDDPALDGTDSGIWRRSRPPYPIYDRVFRWMILGRLRRVEELRAQLAAHDIQEVLRLGDTTLATWLAEVVAIARDRAWAEPLYEWLSRIPEQVALQAMHGMFIEGPLARVLVLLADVLDNPSAARAHFDRALALARSHGAKPLVARLLYEWGSVQRARKATQDARDALEQARELAVLLELPLLERIDAERAALIPQADGRDSRPVAVTLAREGEYWTLSLRGTTVRLRHSRGIELLSMLLASPGREIPAGVLVGSDAADDTGDAGPLLDGRARDAYRARLRELEAELEEAEGFGDMGRSERLRAEAEALRQELSRAFGLGGRARRASSAAERARVNAQRRIADAIRRIRESSPPVGEHLSRCVRTGASCSYDPSRGSR